MDKPSCIDRLKELNVYDLFSYRPEVKVIPRILPEGERIEAASAGISAGKKWMIVFGTTHAYFIHVHLVNGTITRKVPYDSVDRFETGRGLLFGKIILTLGEETITIENCPRKTIRQVEEALRRYVGPPES